MIVNDMHIQGMFVYSKDARYERGDFVIKDGVIFVCTAEDPNNPEELTVSNQLPEENPKNFTIYLGDKVTTLKEYTDYISGLNPNQEDKYVSSHVLSEILNTNCFGFNECGIITQGVLDSIKNNGGGFGYVLTKDLETILGGTTFGYGILDAILFSPSLNNATIKINLRLDEIRNIIGINYRTDFNIDDVVILRQYSLI